MIVFHNLYSEIISIDNLFQAWDEFKKGKLKKLDVGIFERNLEDNLFSIHKELLTKTYKHSSYTGFHITDPKQRHIHKAQVRDRIVYHALFKILNPLFDATFISDSYSCRKNYGTHKGFKKLVIYVRKVSKNYTSNCWALKSDIKKFFDSVDHDILLQIIKRKIKDKDTIWLVEEIVRSYCICHPEFISGSKMPKQVRHDEDDFRHKGIPIGNLTSQLFANIYQNELDQYIKQNLRIKYYLRYADDFVILFADKSTLDSYEISIKRFLNDKLQLELHPRKTTYRKLSWGIDFVGYVALPHYQVLRTKTKRRILRKIDVNLGFYKNEKITEKTLKQSIASYMGTLRHAYTNKIRRKIYSKIEQNKV